jgi:hypothetical protein
LLQRLFAAIDGADRTAGGFEKRCRCIGSVNVVVDDEHAACEASLRDRLRVSPVARFTAGGQHGQVTMNVAPRPGLPLDAVSVPS